MGVDHRANNTSMIVKTPWGSQVQLLGADKNGIEKLRGPKYDLIIFDEAQKFDKLDYAVKEVINPALLDKKGTLILCGTPSKYPSGLFYEVTRDGSPRVDWDSFHWSLKENPYMPSDTWDDIIKDLYAAGLDEEDSGFRREYLGHWVLEDAKFCVHVHGLGDSIFYDELPKGIEWLYTIGVDLGFQDYFTYVVLAWHPKRPEIYEVESFKQTQLDSDQQREIIDQVTKGYSTNAFCDTGGGSSLSLVKAWQNRGMNVMPAKKHEQRKEASYGDINTDLRRGRLLVKKKSHLIKQMREVQWAPARASRAMFEDPKYENDVLDAFIYAYNQCKHYCYRPDKLKPEPGSPEYIEMKELEYLQKLESGEVSRQKTKKQQFAPHRGRLGSYRNKK